MIRSTDELLRNGQQILTAEDEYLQRLSPFADASLIMETLPTA
jgi:hypothetical protein